MGVFLTYPHPFLVFGFCSVYTISVRESVLRSIGTLSTDAKVGSIIFYLIISADKIYDYRQINLHTSMLTKKQKEVLDFIKQYTNESGVSPSYEEIAKGLGVNSKSTIFEHIQALKDKGYLTSDGDGYRSLYPTAQAHFGERLVLLPLAGLITAGQPIEAIETKETFALPSSLVVDDVNSYVLRVKGQSMIEEGIFDGDYVVVERNPSPKNGDVVVALLDNAYATLKKFFRETGRIRLQPANSALKPIFVKDVIIQGVVRAVIRKYSVSWSLLRQSAPSYIV